MTKILARPRTQQSVLHYLRNIGAHQSPLPNVTGGPFLGVDASATKCGFAVAFEGALFTWVFVTAKKGMERMAHIDENLHGILSALPNLRGAVIEGYSYGSKGRAHTTGECVGLVKLGLWRKGIDTNIVSPNGLKKFAIGKGAGNKAAVTLALFKRWGVSITQEDEADAATAALMCAAHYGALAGLITPQREALIKLEILK